MEKTEQSYALNFESLLHFVKMKLLFIFVILVLAVAAGFAKIILVGSTTTYEASASVVTNGYGSNASRLSTFNSIVNTKGFRDRLEDETGADLEKIDLKVTADEGSFVYTVTASSSEDIVTAVANAAAKDLADSANGLKLLIAMSSESSVDAEFKVLENADGSDAVVSAPSKKRTLLIFGLGGLLTALVLVIIMFFFDDSIHTASDLGGLECSGFRLHGSHTEDDAEIAAAKLTEKMEGCKVLAFVSPVSDATERVSYRIARVFEKTGKKVIYVNADFRNDRRPYFAADDYDEEGLAEALDSPDDVGKYIKKYSQNLKYQLPRGQYDTGIGAELQSDALEKIFGHLKDKFDLVIVNAGAVLGYADALAVTKASDLTVMTVATDRTKNRDFKKAMQSLEAVNVHPDQAILAER